MTCPYQFRSCPAFFPSFLKLFRITPISTVNSWHVLNQKLKHKWIFATKFKHCTPLWGSIEKAFWKSPDRNQSEFQMSKTYLNSQKLFPLTSQLIMVNSKAAPRAKKKGINRYIPKMDFPGTASIRLPTKPRLGPRVIPPRPPFMVLRRQPRKTFQFISFSLLKS